MTDTPIFDRRQSNLSRLKLPRITAVLPEMITTAEQQSKSYLSFLYELFGPDNSQKKRLPSVSYCGIF